MGLRWTAAGMVAGAKASAVESPPGAKEIEPQSMSITSLTTMPASAIQ
jgi:hypothetical protein